MGCSRSKTTSQNNSRYVLIQNQVLCRPNCFSTRGPPRIKCHLQRVIKTLFSLKPENILLDKKGYVKLTDFGLSKIIKNNEMAESICGTPEYLAPEIINREGHNKCVDWWCLGCLIYEMITGHPPFEYENRYQLFEAIRTQQPDLPPNVSTGLLRFPQPLRIYWCNCFRRIRRNAWGRMAQLR